MSRKFWNEFLEIYMGHTCLWDASDKDYTNRLKKSRAYEELILKAREFFPEADKSFVTSKINNFRTAFRCTHRKYQSSIETTNNINDVAEPNLWYYDTLLPLLKRSNCRRKTSSDEIEYFLKGEDKSPDSEEGTKRDFGLSCDTEYDLDPEKEIIEVSSDDPNIVFEISTATTDETSVPITPSSSAKPRTKECNFKRKVRRLYPPVPLSKMKPHTNFTKPNTDESIKDFLKMTCKALTEMPNTISKTTQPNNEFIAFGSNISFKLEAISKMSFEQKVFAEKLISDVLFNAQLGKLREESKIVF